MEAKKFAIIIGTILIAIGGLVGLYMNQYLPAAKSAFASIILAQVILLSLDWNHKK